MNQPALSGAGFVNAYKYLVSWQRRSTSHAAGAPFKIRVLLNSLYVALLLLAIL